MQTPIVICAFKNILNLKAVTSYNISSTTQGNFLFN